MQTFVIKTKLYNLNFHCYANNKKNWFCEILTLFSDGLRNFIFLTVYVQNWVMTAVRKMCTEVHFVHWILECDDKWSFLLKGKIMKKFLYPPVQNCNSVNLVKREKSMRMIGFEPGEFCHYWAQALTHCHFQKVGYQHSSNGFQFNLIIVHCDSPTNC